IFVDQFEFGFRGRFSEKIINPGLSGNRRRGEAIVAGDHDRLDAHAPQVRESFLDTALDDVLELDDAEHTGAIGDDQRGTSLARNALHGVLDRWWKLFSERREVLDDRIRSTLADLALADVDAAHPRMRRERHEGRAERA